MGTGAALRRVAALGTRRRGSIRALPHFPLGTLAANLIGGYLVGFAVAYFAARHDLAPEFRLFAITGFLGGLTTFSTFSSEVTQLLLRGEYATGGGLALAHLAGSLAAHDRRPRHVSRARRLIRATVFQT